MKKYILPTVLLISSILIVTLTWELIKFPYDVSKQIAGESYLKNLHHPLNDSLRFVLFLSIPFLTLIFFFQVKEKKFFINSKNLLVHNYRNIKIENHNLNKFFFIFLILIFTEFLTLNFGNYNYFVDIFHEGLWLSASQNSKLKEEFWLSSYVGRGFFGNFHPYLIWKILGIESIGSIRFFHLIIILLNKILLLMISKKITEIVDLDKDKKILFFTLLSIIFLSFTSYGEPVFILRSFLLLVFVIFLLNFFSNYGSKILLFALGFISSISLFWYIDIGAYINFISLILALFFIARLEFKNFVFFVFTILACWGSIFIIFPKEEFAAFIQNTLLIFSTIEYIQGLIFPTPFSGDFRSTRALIVFLITGTAIIYFLKDLNQKNLIFLISNIFLFLIGIIYFKYGLSRSDSVHIRVAQSFVYLPFFSILLYLVFQIVIKKIRFKNYLNFSVIILFIIFINIEKKYENKNVKNITSSFSSIKKLVNNDDKVYLNKDYNDFVIYYKKLTSSDECITLFTHEVALTYFIKKPTCSKFYLMYTSSPMDIQNQLIKDIALKKPSFIVYNSNLDLYGSNSDNLKIVNNFIISRYQFYEKFKHWEIYKINDF